MTNQSQRDLEARSQAILDTAIDAIITIDQHGIIESVNRATEPMLGYRPDELVGRNVSMLMPEPFRSEHDGYLEHYLNTGEKKIIGIGREVVAQHKDGSTFQVHLAVSEFTTGDRRMFTGIIRDISNLKRAQQQLLQSTRLAAIGQMVTGLAHESRNALQRAQAFLDILALDLADAPEQLELTQRTQKALNDLYRLYEEVRHYAAPIHLECRPHNLVAVSQRVWGYLADRQDKNIELRLHCDEVDPVSVDVHRIEQVFRNIFENSIDACSENGTIDVHCEHVRLHDQPAVAIAFHDSGPGLTRESRERLFEPFFTTKQKGTGLGMAICERIVQAHGGTISADPDMSDGTKILVVLPMQPAVKVTPGPQSAQ